MSPEFNHCLPSKDLIPQQKKDSHSGGMAER